MEVCFKFAFALPGTKQLPEVSAEEALQNARKMLELFRGATALIDEIDWVMHPLKSELHWPCGPVRALDMAEATETHPHQSRAEATCPESGSRWRIMGCLVDAVQEMGSSLHAAFQVGVREHKMMMKPNPVVLDRRWYYVRLLPLLATELASFLGPRTPVPREELLSFFGPEGRCGPTLTRLPDAETKLLTLGRQLLHSAGAVPFIGKDCPSTASEFAHPDVAIGLTLLAYRYEGLRKQDFVLLLKLLRAEMDEERGPHARRPTCLRWVSWIREAGGRVTGFSWAGQTLSPEDEARLDSPPANQPLLEDDGLEELRANVWPLERVSLKDKQQVHLLWCLLRRTVGAVKYYLYEHVFPGVMGLSDSLLSCTAQDGGTRCRRLGFSGTPSEVLPASMGKIHYEQGCDAKILSTLLNANVVTRTETLPAGWDPAWLLQRAATGEFHALIDAGALVAASKLLESLPSSSFFGVVFLTEADESVVLVRDGRILPLADCGLFYDHVHTTGLDVPQAPYARAALTLGKDMLWRDYAQAAFRMRGLGPGAAVSVLTAGLLEC
eukprot:s424_g4.t1